MDNVEFLKLRIEEEYNFNWVIDGLPAAQLYEDDASKEIFYNAGVPLGFFEDSTYYLNNHYNIHVHYHPRDQNRIRVVGIVVTPKRYS
jgi:transmembrane 9 superfamily protein 2/4